MENDSDKEYNGNFHYPRSLEAHFPKTTRLNYNSRSASSSCKVNNILSSINTYNLATPSSKNSWIFTHMSGGWYTTNIILGDIKLKFKDGKSYTFKEAVDNKYIEPLVIAASSDSSTRWRLTGVLNVLTGGRTDQASYTSLFLFYKVKEVELTAIEFYSSVNYSANTNYCDGLNVYQASEDFDITIK